MGGAQLWVRLRERRRELGLGTKDAATACGVSQPTYSRWENGRAPDEDCLCAIATFLGVSRAEVVLLRSGEDPAAVIDERVEALGSRLDELEAKIRRLPDPPAGPRRGT